MLMDHGPMRLIMGRVVSSVVVVMSSDRIVCGRLMVIVHPDLIAVALRKQTLIGGLRYVSIPKEFGLLEEFNRGEARKEFGQRSMEGVRLS